MNQDVKTLIETTQHIKFFKNFYYHFSGQGVSEDLHTLFPASDIQNVKERFTILTQFVVTCIVAMLVVISIALAIVVPSCLSLSVTAAWISAVTVISLFLVLSFGAGLVLYYMHSKKDYFLGETHNFFQKRVFSQVLLEVKKQSYKDAVLDISTLDKEGNGIILTHNYFSPEQKNCIKKDSAMAILCLPFITAGTIAYNFARIIGMPLYIVTRLIKESLNKEAPSTFKLQDIPKAMLSSLQRALIAPFYATAMFFSLAYSLISTKTGRIMTGMIERAWNEDVPLSQGVQLLANKNCRLKHADWKWKSGFTPQHLGHKAFYLAGCMQPTGIFLIEKWKIICGMRQSSLQAEFPLPLYLYKKDFVRTSKVNDNHGQAVSPQDMPPKDLETTSIPEGYLVTSLLGKKTYLPLASRKQE